MPYPEANIYLTNFFYPRYTKSPLRAELAKSREVKPPGIIQTVGFDVDGTLLDSMTAFRNVFGTHMQTKFGIPVEVAGAHFARTLGRPTSQQIQSLLTEQNILRRPDKQAIEEIGLAIDEQLAQTDGKPFPEVPAMLTRLKQQGYRMFVSSGHETTVVRDKLRRTNLAQYFDFWLGVESLAKGIDRLSFRKGEHHYKAAAYLYSFEQYEDFLKQFVYVNDSTGDLAASYYTMAKVICRAGTRTREELRDWAFIILDDLSTLPEVLVTEFRQDMR